MEIVENETLFMKKIIIIRPFRIAKSGLGKELSEN